jgi:D-amino-acid dehydrogenase
MRICVLGAGIVGLATAHELQCEGHQVSLLDQDGAGAGASGANGAQLSYAYVQPLADPAIWRQLPQLLLAADSPFKLRPRWDAAQWRWGVQFLAACRAPASRRTTAQLLALAAESRAAFEQWLAAEQPDCDFSASGKLVLYRDARSFAAARRQLEVQRALGAQQWAVSACECIGIEPALAGAEASIAGGIYTPGECAADCHKACQALLRTLRGAGAHVLFGTRALQWVVRRGRASALRTSAGDIEADAFVVCLGSGSPKLARPLGIRLPIYPLKGYSITLPASPLRDAAPRVSVTDAARKIVFARIGQRLRVAGMAELVGEDTTIPARRIASLLAATREMFPRGGEFGACEPWAGLRPATPTGLPIVGTQPKGPSNVLFNTGHGALGFTLAFGSARRIARQLRGAMPVAATATPAAPAPCSA